MRGLVFPLVLVRLILSGNQLWLADAAAQHLPQVRLLTCEVLVALLKETVAAHSGPLAALILQLLGGSDKANVEPTQTEAGRAKDRTVAQGLAVNLLVVRLIVVL